MKRVTVTFAGPQSDELAKKFYAYLVDGGLEDQVSDTLSTKDLDLEITDFNNETLDVLFSSKEKACPATSQKAPSKRKLS
ncbi:MAG: hypothetical protein WA705_14845 [Candidatus Ozemobacteraceae bacterium]